MNNYILEYYQAIRDGSEPAGRWILAWYEYIVKGLERGSFFYAAKKAKACIVFAENFCRHHEGELAPGLIKLELWQKAFLSVVFGIVDKDGNRQFREIVLVVARKAGKTLMAAIVSAYLAYMDGEYGARIYMAAPKLEQARLCFDAFFQMVQKEPRLAELSQKRRTDVFIESSNTTIKPLAFSAKKSDGLNVQCGICDEVASWQGDQGIKFYEVLKSSQGARKQPMLLSLTTAGYVSGGIYDELIARSTRLLMGNGKETRLAPFLYMIDNTDKWNDINELRKANPNLGISVSVDYMLEEIAIAEGSLSKKTEFLTKYCNVKQHSTQAAFPAVAVEKASGEHIDPASFANCYCVGGIDLSRTTDLTACTAVVQKNGELYVLAKFFLPSAKLEEAIARDGLPYDIYAQRGLLQLSGENFVDYHDCEAFFRELVERWKIYPLQVGYDRYTAQYLIQDMEAYGFHCDDVFQGFNLTPVINEFGGLLKDGRIHIGDNDLLKIHLLNTALKHDNQTERVRLVKISTNDHIDGTAALLDAFTVRQKHWKEIGGQLENKGR
ncbi:MAG: terminase large subunit [Oscillospiraceae bacterium]|nr:terminase large subunit [Oscillospiraceae bacterium]